MILLASTSDELRLTCNSAASVDVHATWTDFNTTTQAVTPGRTNTQITSTSPTTIVGSPGANTVRTIKTFGVRNKHATAPTNVILVHRATGPVDSEIIESILPPGASFHYDEHLGFTQVMPPDGPRKVISNSQFRAPTIGDLYCTVLSFNISNSNATANRLMDVPNLAFPVMEDHRYWFRYVLQYQVTATSTGSRWTIYGPGSVTALRYKSELSLTTTTKSNLEGSSTYDSPAASNASSAATVANIAIVEGFIDMPTSDGLVFPRFASEVAGSLVLLRKGSMVHWQRMT